MLAVVSPPLIKPAEPALSSGAAARHFAALGVPALAVDASIGWYRFALDRKRLAATAEAAPSAERPVFRRAARSVAGGPLRRKETYDDRRVYTSHIRHLEHALRLAARAFSRFSLQVAEVEVEALRVERSADLALAAELSGPFDEYFETELIPSLVAAGASAVALSLTYTSQAFAAFRLGRLLRERLPGIRLVLGGPLVACWAAAGALPAFPLFDRVAPALEAMAELARELGGTGEGAPPEVATVALDGEHAPPWEAYLSPWPRVPASLGRGCRWRRCTFCPDHLHPRHSPAGEDAVAAWLEAVARRFPSGAILHLCDSALAPAHLGSVARTIRERGLPLRWHGFVRVEEPLADPAFVEELATGGCLMLQLGVESASERLLENMGKGAGPVLAQAVLRATAGAGIKNLVYLLFGLPTETDEDRERTLAFVEENAASIHDLNLAILNLPRRSPMHTHPDHFGISEIVPFSPDTDLSLADDFRSGASHPRLEARRWLDRRLRKSAAVREIAGETRDPFQANHACFLRPRGPAGSPPCATHRSQVDTGLPIQCGRGESNSHNLTITRT